ncbi:MULTISPECIES: phage tail assembly chaperone [Asaia]|uniref:Uncharacterized protein n=1 Tax=Asaia bogorensis TaxID=91915 RepID=A0A060QJZ5_9PROT|nr:MULTISPECIES: hypothetical protein [Asaia]ETC97970.1 hypothetical protein P792_12095 [Asaia sp. SF2.1]CDG41310.1 hypothetical protein ASAP_3265 [Asaia bogorensis]
MRLEPRPDLVWIWRAWHRLSTERPHTVIGTFNALGGGFIESRPEPIPWSALTRWAAHYGLSVQEMTLLERCVIALDAVYLKHWSDRFTERRR